MHEALSFVGATVQGHLLPFPAAVTGRSRAPYRRSNDNKCTAEVEQPFFLILVLGSFSPFISTKVAIPTDAL